MALMRLGHWLEEEDGGKKLTDTDMQRVLAHKVVYLGNIYKMSVVEISDDRHLVVITPYRGETHSTRFVSGTVEVVLDDTADGGCYFLREL